MKPRKPLPRSKTPIRRSPITRGGKPAPRNAKRSAKNRARANGSEEYKAWLHEQPCAACGYRGEMELAHAKTGGMGRKADAKFTTPLCAPHLMVLRDKDGVLSGNYEGCHHFAHRVGVEEFAAYFGKTLLAMAEETQAHWLAHSGGNP